MPGLWREAEGGGEMKILKEGDPKRLRRPIVFQCLNCGCEFEAEKYE